MYTIFFIHSSIDEYLGCFHVLAIINSAATHTGVHVSFWIVLFSEHMPSSGVVMSYGNFIPNLLRNLHTVLHSGCTNLHLILVIKCNTYIKYIIWFSYLFNVCGVFSENPSFISDDGNLNLFPFFSLSVSLEFYQFNGIFRKTALTLLIFSTVFCFQLYKFLPLSFLFSSFYLLWFILLFFPNFFRWKLRVLILNFSSFLL